MLLNVRYAQSWVISLYVSVDLRSDLRFIVEISKRDRGAPHMRDTLTISQLSQLMNVSVHQLRYFEEKGVLYPAFTEDNQYRMYGIDEIYQLSHVLLLRKLNIPVSQIEQCLTSYSGSQYKQVFEQSLTKVQEEIHRLVKLEQFIHKVLSEQAEMEGRDQEVVMVSLGPRYLRHWLSLDEHQVLTAGTLYEHRPAPSDLYEQDLHYLTGGGVIRICYETMEPADYVLEEGDYLLKNFSVHREEEIEQEVLQLEQYIQEHGYTRQGQIVVIEKSYLSMFSNEQLHYQIQAKVGLSERVTENYASIPVSD